MLTVRTPGSVGYMGEAKAEAYGKRNAVPEESLVRAKIVKVIARADIAG